MGFLPMPEPIIGASGEQCYTKESIDQVSRTVANRSYAGIGIAAIIVIATMTGFSLMLADKNSEIDDLNENIDDLNENIDDLNENIDDLNQTIIEDGCGGYIVEINESLNIDYESSSDFNVTSVIILGYQIDRASYDLIVEDYNDSAWENDSTFDDYYGDNYFEGIVGMTQYQWGNASDMLLSGGDGLLLDGGIQLGTNKTIIKNPVNDFIIVPIFVIVVLSNSTDNESVGFTLLDPSAGGIMTAVFTFENQVTEGGQYNIVSISDIYKDIGDDPETTVYLNGVETETIYMSP